MKSIKIVTAAMLAIGDELLSGRTKDKNIAYLADFLTVHGIDLKEVRIVADEQSAIVAAVNALRQSYDLVFTSGGIGPTHDDITAGAIAAAFEVPIDHDPKAVEILEKYYMGTDYELTPARMRMARIPEGASLIANSISGAPGFKLENVHVMAGVPPIFQAMLAEVSPTLAGGTKMLSEAIDCPFGEGTIGDPLAEIQKQNPETAIGSYPRREGGRFTTQLVVKSRNVKALDKAMGEIRNMLDKLAKQ